MVSSSPEGVCTSFSPSTNINKRIQSFVFLEEVIVDVIIGGSKLVAVGFVRGWAGKLHLVPSAEGANIKSLLTVGTKGDHYKKEPVKEERILTLGR